MSKMFESKSDKFDQVEALSKARHLNCESIVIDVAFIELNMNLFVGMVSNPN